MSGKASLNGADTTTPSMSRLSLSVSGAGGVSGTHTNGRPSISSFAPSLSKIAHTSIIIEVKGRVASNHSRVSQLYFSPGGSRLVALTRHQATVPAANHRRWQHLHVIDTLTQMPMKLWAPGLFDADYRVLAEDGACAIGFGPETLEENPAAKKTSVTASSLFSRKDKAVAAELPPVRRVMMAFLAGRQHGEHQYFNLDTNMVQMELGSLKTGSNNHNVPISEPIAMSPDGSTIIGRSAEDATEIYLIRAPPAISHSQAAALKVPACIPGHLAKITHLQYRPDGSSIVSVSADGVHRVTNVSGASPGQCLYRVRIDTKGYAARLVAVSPDGQLVASVWGRQVVRWYPETDVLMVYDLDEVRLVETWPLAFSADCSLLVCRTENGVDIVRVEDGTSAGHLNWTQNGGNFATAGAMSTDGKQLALGLLNGRVMLHELHYVEESSIDKDVPEEEPPAYSKYDD